MLDRQGYSAAVINPRFVKPLDRELLEVYAKKVSAIVTFEDHVLMGGFGSAVIEALNDMNLSVPVVRVGWLGALREQVRSRTGAAELTQWLQRLSPSRWRRPLR